MVSSVRALCVAMLGHMFRDHNYSSPLPPWAPALPLQALLGDSGGQNWSTGMPDKYGRLDRELQLANSHFIEEQQAQQQVLGNHPLRTGVETGTSPVLPATWLCC